MNEPAGRSEWSSGTPIVILPGLLCDGRMFSDQLGPLQAEVLNGFYEEADTIEAMATLALQRLPDRSVLIGHSMGGRIELEIWRQAPERVSGLVLADTGVHPVEPGEPAARYGLRDLGRSEGAEALVDRWLPPMVAPANRDRSDLMRTLSAMAVDAGVACFARQTEALLSRPDARPVLATITCPTLVLCGAEDAWSPPAQHQEIAAAIPGAVVQLVPGAGHMAPAEAPAAFNDAVLRWLALPAPTR